MYIRRDFILPKKHGPDAEGLDLRSAVRSGRSPEDIKADVIEFVRHKHDVGRPMQGIPAEAHFQPCLAAVGG